MTPLRYVNNAISPGHREYGWAISGNWGASMVTAFYPPNMYRKVRPDGSASQYFAGSSLHPGGLNVLTGDGSTRFVSESIQTWPFDPANGAPVGITSTAAGAWANIPRPGVWQAMATRNGGETVDDPAY